MSFSPAIAIALVLTIEVGDSNGVGRQTNRYMSSLVVSLSNHEHRGSSFDKLRTSVGILNGWTQQTNDTAALSLRATITSAANAAALTITLLRWSTEAERAPLLAAFAAPPPAPAARPAPTPPAGGRGRGRGAPPPPPPSPFARLSAAIKAAPTLGYIWTDGVTGYSIKYAWRAPGAEEQERIVLVTDRRLNSHAPDWAAASGAAGDAEFTVIELRIDGQGTGEGKTSLTTNVAVDTAAKTLALEGYAAAPAVLKVTR